MTQTTASKTIPTDRLPIALVHLNVKKNCVADNAKKLLELSREAAQSGHKIIVNTEMALSGYSFDSIQAIRPYAQTLASEPVAAIAALAREFQVFVCTGMAMADPDTGIVSNAALVFGPTGKPVCVYHKINAEARWACPGDPRQDNVFDTPWGRVGVLICSDTYHGLAVRQTALKGADLILVPANWPPTGLNPTELWAIRARENGIYLAACNRTGLDRDPEGTCHIMDCTQAPSAVFGPRGETLVCEIHPESSIVSASVPLKSGKICSRRSAVLATRNPEQFSAIYLDLRYAANNEKALTDWYSLPAPGPFCVAATTGSPKDTSTPQRLTCAMIEATIFPPKKNTRGYLLIFPLVTDNFRNIEGLLALISRTRPEDCPAVCFSRMDSSQGPEIIFIAPGVAPVRHNRTGRVDNGSGIRPDGLTLVETGTARIGLVLAKDLCHPETGIAHAKLGCDLLVSSTGPIREADRRVMAGRCMDKLAVAVAGTDCAFVCAPPKGHQRSEASLACPDENGRPGRAAMTLDTAALREKIFQDRMDFPTLLSGTRPQFPGAHPGSPLETKERPSR